MSFKLRDHLQHFPDTCNAVSCIKSEKKIFQVAPYGFKKIFADCNIKNVAEALQQNQVVLILLQCCSNKNMFPQKHLV